ncbi:MAG TPA: ABC transporter permease [Bryobacteraceae bacterium]|nr:ABC transporter permease [Bryobacteraceae bacterium]
MSLWRQLSRGLRVLAHRRAADQDIADEVSHYLEESAAAFEARGLSPEEARRAARMEIGTAAALQEQVRGYGWENGVETLFADLRHAARRLCRNPGFTTVGVLTLALGIGAATAIFSLIEAVLWKPLPYPHSERLVALRHTAPGIHMNNLNLSAALYFTYSEENRAFQQVAMWKSGSATITGLAEPEEVPVLWVTHGFLPALEVQPALGRWFTALDDSPAGGRTVILTDGWWKARFGGDPSVVGRRILIDGNASEVIGILPASFTFMDRRFSLLLPQRLDRATVPLISFCCQGIARLKPGVSLAQATADVARMIPMAPAKFRLNPGTSAAGYRNTRIGPNLRFLKEELVGDIGRTLWVLMGTVGIVLLIACANVANLLLVRADGRRQELSIRAALGACWTRIARHLLLESALLGIAGGACGLALAYGALRALAAIGPEHLPRLHEIRIDPIALAFTMGTSLAAGLLFGLIPVWRYARPQLSEGLRGGGRSLSASRQRHRARNVLIAVQVALALVLLVSSGLMIRTFQALRRVDPGFTHPQQIETFRVSIPYTQVAEPEMVIRTEEAVLRRVQAFAGVSAAGMVDTLPLDPGSTHPLYAEDHPQHDGSVPAIRQFKMVAPGYAAAVGCRLIAGRDLTWAETYSQAPVALISENLAREWWHDPRAAIGKRIRTALTDDWREVVGVLQDTHDDGIDQRSPGMVYWPLWQKNWAGPGYVIRSVAFVIRTPRAGTARLRQELQQAVAGVNAGLAVADVQTLETVYDRSLARASFTLALLAVAAGMALLLALVGIYGVVSYSVSQRNREIGIRLALGAAIDEVIGLFVRQALALSGVGAACGLAIALLLTRLMKSLLFEVSPVDPLTYAAALAGLILAAALASYLPARRATRVDPAEALRLE